MHTIETSTSAFITTHGFTGHEHMDDFRLINMNGRVYDPVLGRFISPDPFISDPTSTQDYNRYSYCNNNPLMYTDPSGYTKYYRTEIPEPTGLTTGFGGGGSVLNAYMDARLDGYSGDFWAFNDAYREAVVSNTNAGLTYTVSANYYTGNYAQINPGIIHPDDPLGAYCIVKREEATYTYVYTIPGSAAGQGGNGFDDYLAAANGAVNTYAGVMGDAFYSTYHHMQKNGIIRSAKFAANNPNKIYQTSRSGVEALTKNARMISKGTGMLGSAISVYQFANEPTWANLIDGAAGATTFIPVVGWAISGTYFISNLISVAYDGQTIGERIAGDARVW